MGWELVGVWWFSTCALAPQCMHVCVYVCMCMCMYMSMYMSLCMCEEAHQSGMPPAIPYHMMCWTTTAACSASLTRKCWCLFHSAVAAWCLPRACLNAKPCLAAYMPRSLATWISVFFKEAIMSGDICISLCKCGHVHMCICGHMSGDRRTSFMYMCVSI